jgi:hypothetical protein
MMTGAIYLFNFILFNTILLLPFALFFLGRQYLERPEHSASFRCNPYFLVAILLVGGLSALRPIYIGTDYKAYIELYNYIVNTGLIPAYLEKKEAGFRFLNYIFASCPLLLFLLFAYQ